MSPLLDSRQRKKPGRTITDTTTTPRGLRGTDGSNPASSCGEEYAAIPRYAGYIFATTTMEEPVDTGVPTFVAARHGVGGGPPYEALEQLFDRAGARRRA
jgi:hypothetical protein